MCFLLRMEREPVPPAFMRDKLFVAFRAKRTPHELYDALKATGLFRIIDHKEGQLSNGSICGVFVQVL